MDFYPYEPFDAYKAETAVWQTIKTAFRNEPGVAFHSYQLFDKHGSFGREIDILIVHRTLGLWIIECKGCYISNVESINGSEWKMKNWHINRERPVSQAKKQMFALKNHLSEHLNYSCSLLYFNLRVAIPFINQKQWQLKRFHNLPNTQGVVLPKENLISEMFKQNLTKCAGSRQRNLTDEQWHSLMCVLGGTNQTPVDNSLSFTLVGIAGEKEKLPQADNSLAVNPEFKTIGLSCIVSDKQAESQLELLSDEEDDKSPCQSQVNNILSITAPQCKLEFTIEEDELPIINSNEPDEFLEAQSDEDDAKSGKVAKSRRRAQTKKKQYTEDSIRLYLQEIGRIRLLRVDEEIELARKIADLLELERVRERLCDQLDRDPYDSEWAEAVKLTLSAFRYRLHIGRRAKDKMVQSNLRLVVSIAKKYMNRGLSFQDLIQEGSLGLIRAAEKFDHEKGYKFSTYATWWIRQAITRAIADQSRTIRLPVHLYETISRIKKTTKLLSQEMGRKPTEEEIATRMEMTIEKLRFIAKFAQLPISLETHVYVGEEERDSWFDEGDAHEYLYLADLIEAKEETPEDRVSQSFMREDLENVLDSLSPRERDVLRMRYGLDDGRMKTLKEIGQIFNITRERVRQIEAKALRKLRHSNRNSVLKEYIHEYQMHGSREKKYEEQSEANHSYTDYVQKGVGCHKRAYALGAIENFTQALQLDPNSAQIYYCRGLAKTEAEAHKGAIEDFTQAIRLNPKHIDAYYQRGHVRYGLGDSREAIEDYSQVIRLNPNEALAYFYRGVVRTSLGQMRGAISNYNQALKINPNFAEAYYHRGVALHHLGDLHRAVEDYNQALRIYPNLAEAYSRRGLALCCLGNYQGALEDYSQAVQINSEDGLTYYYRALVYENLSDYMKALEDFNQVLVINPNFVKAYYNQGYIHYKLGNYQKAFEDLDRSRRINSNNTQAYNK